MQSPPDWLCYSICRRLVQYLLLFSSQRPTPNASHNVFYACIVAPPPRVTPSTHLSSVAMCAIERFMKRFPLFTATLRHWKKPDIRLYSAAVAYYAFFSLAPLLILIVAVAALFFRSEQIWHHMAGQLSETVGASAVNDIQRWVAAISRPSHSITASIIGLLLTLYGASRVFWHLQMALDSIWDHPRTPRRSGTRLHLYQQAKSLGTVIISGLLMILSLILSTSLSTIHHITKEFPLVIPYFNKMWRLVEMGGSLTVVWVTLMVTYRFLAPVRLPLRQLWKGALAATILFTLGKYALASYLAFSGFNSTYGVAGSLAVVLLWIYYSANMIFFGAIMCRHTETHR